MKIVRPNIRISPKLGGLARAHSAMQGISVAKYIGELVYNDLKNRYPEWMEGVTRDDAFIPLKK